MNLRSDSDGPNTTASQGMEERGKPSFPCNICGRILQSKSGRTNHEKKCKMKGPVIKANSGVEEENSTMQTSTVKLLTSHLEQSVEMNTLPPEPPDPPPSTLVNPCPKKSNFSKTPFMKRGQKYLVTPLPTIKIFLSQAVVLLIPSA